MADTCCARREDAYSASMSRLAEDWVGVYTRATSGRPNNPYGRAKSMAMSTR